MPRKRDRGRGGAAERDRPEVYADHRVLDMTDMPADERDTPMAYDFNGRTCVAALGFGDIPPEKRYRHRLATNGEPLHDIAMVGTTAEPIPETLLASPPPPPRARRHPSRRGRSGPGARSEVISARHRGER